MDSMKIISISTVISLSSRLVSLEKKEREKKKETCCFSWILEASYF
jgi:hypothetical protein